MRGNDPHPLAYCLDSTGWRPGVLVRKEAVAALDIPQSLRRPDQLWHSGGSAFWPSSSLASQASASA